MAAYLLDTNHASPLVTLHHPLRLRVISAMDAGDTYAINAVILAETLFGISVVPRATRNRAIWAQIQPALTCYISDAQDAAQATDLQLALRKQGRQLATIDALIAVTALRYDLILLTTDNDFVTVPGLRRENWLQATV
jgi:tRNA(fMet)-specific endonuclease VapC